MMSWSGSVYEYRLCTTLTWNDLNPLCIILCGRQTACRWWLVCSCCDKQEVRCHVCLNLSCLHYGCQRCTPAVAQHCHALPFTYWVLLSAWAHLIFGKYLNAHLKFTIYGRKQAWPVVLHTHLRNAVPLVWGSLRLAPTTSPNIKLKQRYILVPCETDWGKVFHHLIHSDFFLRDRLSHVFVQVSAATRHCQRSTVCSSWRTCRGWWRRTWTGSARHSGMTCTRSGLDKLP